MVRREVAVLAVNVGLLWCVGLFNYLSVLGEVYRFVFQYLVFVGLFVNLVVLVVLLVGKSVV